jgi:hypothetical protein
MVTHVSVPAGHFVQLSTVNPSAGPVSQTGCPAGIGLSHRHVPRASEPQSCAGVQVTQTPPVQVPLMQSLATEQVLPLAQRGQEPPQSTSVSVPFLMPSEQVGTTGATGAAQTPPWQNPTLHGVPPALAWHVPFLHFLPWFVFLHLPFLHV